MSENLEAKIHEIMDTVHQGQWTTNFDGGRSAILYVAYKARTKQGKVIPCHAASPAVMSRLDLMRNVSRESQTNLRRVVMETARMSLQELVRRQLGHRVGLKGHRGRFLITDIFPVTDNGHHRSRP